ncbi:ribosome maturation factor RimM [Corynebacterium ulceribovis]|uniref:ribosome maturation factor RimM n=1 Tax=Corynebacterium ulceribovis TaxID=487732 RepID=UPI00037D01C6|nr:ribosome maturation factor RimM [Corynebacterium ulceribovis]
MELRIGHVVKSHGIKGEVVVEVTTDEPEVRFAVGEVLTGRQGRKEHELTIDTARVHQGRLLIKFKEVPDRTAADSLRGTKFIAAPLIDEDDDGFYDHELEGLRVLHDGTDIGVVTGVMHVPGRQILEVELDGGDNSGKEALIPFVHDIVPEVDLDAGCVVITPPDGLLEL